MSSARLAPAWRLAAGESDADDASDLLAFGEAEPGHHTGGALVSRQLGWAPVQTLELRPPVGDP